MTNQDITIFRPGPARGLACLAQALLAVILLLSLTGEVRADDHLRVIQSGPYSVLISWTAPGDDLNVGQATRYDIRHHSEILTEENWNLATVADFELRRPRPAGAADSALIQGLVPDSTYYLAIRTADEVFNWSPISTVISFHTDPLTNNLVISDARVTNINTTTATVQWTTNLPATSQVAYGPGDFTAIVPSVANFDDLTLDHAVLLTDLAPNTDYICLALCQDGDSNYTIGDSLFFKTNSIVTNQGGDTLTGLYFPSYVNHKPLLAVNNLDTNSGNYYLFQLSDDPTFSTILESSGSISQNPDYDTTTWRPDDELEVGIEYYWRASANDGSFFEPLAFEIQNKVYFYPNPFRTSQADHVTFVNLPEGSVLSIFTLSGELVKRFPNINGGTQLWDGTNGAGRVVASEKYLWYIEGTDLSGKLILIR